MSKSKEELYNELTDKVTDLQGNLITAYNATMIIHLPVLQHKGQSYLIHYTKDTSTITEDYSYENVTYQGGGWYITEDNKVLISTQEMPRTIETLLKVNKTSIITLLGAADTMPQTGYPLVTPDVVPNSPRVYGMEAILNWLNKAAKIEYLSAEEWKRYRQINSRKVEEDSVLHKGGILNPGKLENSISFANMDMKQSCDVLKGKVVELLEMINNLQDEMFDKEPKKNNMPEESELSNGEPVWSAPETQYTLTVFGTLNLPEAVRYIKNGLFVSPYTKKLKGDAANPEHLIAEQQRRVLWHLEKLVDFAYSDKVEYAYRNYAHLVSAYDAFKKEVIYYVQKLAKYKQVDAASRIWPPGLLTAALDEPEIDVLVLIAHEWSQWLEQQGVVQIEIAERDRIASRASMENGVPDDVRRKQAEDRRRKYEHLESLWVAKPGTQVTVQPVPAFDKVDVEISAPHKFLVPRGSMDDLAHKIRECINVPIQTQTIDPEIVAIPLDPPMPAKKQKKQRRK